MAHYVYMYYVRAGLLTDEDVDRLCEIFFPAKHERLYDKRGYLSWYINKFPFIKDMLDAMIGKAFDAAGMTLKDSVKMLKDSFETAKKKEQAKTMFEIATFLLEKHEAAINASGHDPELTDDAENTRLLEGAPGDMPHLLPDEAQEVLADIEIGLDLEEAAPADASPNHI